jgi:hypothetical protein
MERERNTDGMQKAMQGIFAVVIAGIAIVLVIFVVRRVGEMQDVCATGIGGMDVGEVCGED